MYVEMDYAFCFPRRFYARGVIFGDCVCILLPCENLCKRNLYVKVASNLFP